jgi:hypothetical protein
MRSAIEWDIPQRVVAILYRRFGTIYRSHLEDRTASVKNYHHTPLNIPEERRFHILRSGRKLKSREKNVR